MGVEIPVSYAVGYHEFLMSTGLRPYLDPLDANGKVKFLAVYEAGLAAASLAMRDGQVLLRFPRLFFAGVR